MAKKVVQEEQLQVTPAREFRRPRVEGTLKRLGSGRVIRWKPIELHRLYLAGDIPDLLKPLVASRIWGEKDEDRDASFRKYWTVKLFVVSVAVIEPKVVEDPSAADEIAVTDFFDDEIDEIYEMATEPAKELHPFRPQQGGDAQPGQGGDEAGATTE